MGIGFDFPDVIKVTSSGDYDKMARERSASPERPDIVLSDQDWNSLCQEAALHKRNSYNKNTEIHRLNKEVQAQRRRLEAMDQAIASWRERAGIDPPLDGFKLLFCERRLRMIRSENNKWNGVWFFLEYYLIPGVAKAPELIREAWLRLEEAGRLENTERIYYHEAHGWVAVLRAEW